MGNGRRTELTPELQKAIVDRLSAGATIADTCRDVGISEATFYNWTKRGRDELARLEQPGTRERKSETRCVEFLEATTRARGRAKMTAISAIARNLFETETVTEGTDTLSEIRLRRNKEGEMVPYTYTKTTTKRLVTKHPPDWRAAVEFLKRRYRDEWSEKTIIQAADPQEEMLELLRRGEITIEDMIAAFGTLDNVRDWLNDESLARQLFEEAGIDVSEGEDPDGSA